MHAVPGHLVEPLELDASGVEVRPEGLLESLLLAAHVEGRQPARGGDHAEHPHRRLDRQGGRGMRCRHMTDERLLAAQVHAGLGVEEGLPRQRGEARCGEAQRDLHARAPLGRDRHARAVGGADLAAERRVEQASTHVLHDRLGVRHHASRRDRRRQHRRLEQRPAIHELVEVDRDRLRRFAASDRLQHVHHVGARVGAGPDLQLHDRVHARILVVLRSRRQPCRHWTRARWASGSRRITRHGSATASSRGSSPWSSPPRCTPRPRG